MAAIAPTVLLPSCYFLVPYSDLTGGVVDGGASDAASKDGGGASDGAAPDGHFCEGLTPPPTFCDDFDEGDTLAAKWKVGSDPAGTLGIDTSASTSPPASLHVAVPATTGSAPGESVSRSFDVTSEIRLSFDARIDKLGDTTENVTLVSITTNDQGTTRTLLYYIAGAGGGSAEMEEEHSPPFRNWPNTLPVPTVGNWVHYDLDLDISNPSAPKLSVAVGGVPQLSNVTTGQPWRPGSYDVAVGLSWLNASHVPWEIHYDNVVVAVR